MMKPDMTPDLEATPGGLHAITIDVCLYGEWDSATAAVSYRRILSVFLESRVR